MPDYQLQEVSVVPRLPVADPFADQFAAQFGTTVSTTARELRPGAILPTSEVSLDFRKDVGLRDRGVLNEFEASLVQKGTPIAPKPMSMAMKVIIALLLVKALT